LKHIKIAHCGNIANTAYTYVKQLRRKGYDIDLLLDKHESVFGYPQWEDGDFEISGIKTALKGLTVNDVVDIVGRGKWGDAPKWVKCVGNGIGRRLKDPSIVIDDIKEYKLKQLYSFSRISSFKDPFLSLDWIKAMKQYDVLHTWGRQTALAPLSGKPYIATVVGGDIMGACGDLELHMPTKEMLEKGFRQAKYVIFHDPGLLSFTRRLGLKNATIFPSPVDIDKYKPEKTPLRNNLLNRYNCEIILYNPSRQDWYWKGSDKMIRAFAKFVKEDNNKAHLLLGDWGVDLERTMQLISKLKISEYVDFVPAMAKRRLVEYYNASDVILDAFNNTDFSFYTFGLITLEALSCGKPVIIDFAPEKLQEHYPGNIPIRNAKSTTQIYERLIELNDEERRLEAGRKSREWILKYFNGKKLADKLMRFYEKAVG
jgi:glycosyltransferase involved in cell wall biosynthesis